MMGRRTGVSAEGKAPAAKQGKPGEVPKGPKRQQRKPVAAGVSSGLKKKPVKSKPGFTLYSGSSKVEENQGAGHVGAGSESLPKGRIKGKHVNKSEQMTGATPEIVSQVQLQEEKTKSSHSSSLYIPTADPEESISETEDFMVSTPFNKRLVSSTPDPERLREAESEDQLQNYASNGLPPETVTAPPLASIVQEDSPQMIPERDIVTTRALAIPPDTTGLAASVAKSLAEKLRLQREATQPGEASHPVMGATSPSSSLTSANQIKPVPAWKQKHQKWKQELQQYKKDQSGAHLVSEEKDQGVLNSIVISDANIELPSQISMTKAEWISDSISTLGNKNTSLKSSVEGPRREQANLQPVLGLKDLSKITTDSGINSTEISTPAVSVVKTKVSNPGTSSTSFLSLPTTLSSFQSKTVAPPLPDHYKDYERFKSGIIQNRNDTGKRTLPSRSNAALHAQTASCADSISLHPISASTATAQSNVATMTSTLTHTTTVSTLSSSVKVCETVAGPSSCTQMVLTHTSAPTQPENCADLIPKFDLIHNSKITFGKDEKKLDNSGKFQKETNNLSDRNGPSTSAAAQENSVIVVPTAAYLDSSADSQNSGQSKIVVASGRGKQKSQSQDIKDEALETDHSTSYLSEVINFLKTDGFNAKEKANKEGCQSMDSENPEEDSQVKQHQQIQHNGASSSADANLREIMSQYLPQNAQKVSKPSEHVLESPKADLVSSTGKTPAQQDLNNSNSAQADKADSNQNYNSDDSSSYDQPRRRKKSRNLYYLESMADPTLRDIACRLAFKATALRDVELRDLIDDMIFHTDAALGHEDARYQSSNLFLQEENSKLKKRLHNVNRQLDAKERQEKMAATSVYSISNNEILHMERKMMHLCQEKDRLDAQLTALLEEKSRWLVTQQDLVKTVSLKDHEILKLEEKHQQDRIKLHQSLDHATQNSQGVHYKLSVADREISNMEQRLKCRDLDIADLREKLRVAELSVGKCEQQVTAKDQEIFRLKDMVDTLKLGVDHVLQMFEGGSVGPATTDQQRQGIDSLYRMAHPERFASGLERPAPSYQHFQLQGQPETGRQQGFFALPPRFGQAPGVSTQTSDRLAHPLPIRPEPRYADGPQQTTLNTDATGRSGESAPQNIMSWMQQRLYNLTQGQTKGEESHERHPSQETGLDNRLTAATLEEHNQRLSPIDRRLWRSMQESPFEVAAEPYYSDSEIEMSHRQSRKRSRKGLKSILKHGKGRASQRVWQTSTPTREEYYQDLDDERSQRPYSSGQERKGRARRKSESDKYIDPRGSYRNSQRSQEDRSKRVRSATPKERREKRRSWQEEADDEGNDSRYSMSDYFRKKSQMPRLPKSPQRGSRETVRSRGQHDSQSSKHSTLFSVPIPETSDSWGQRTQEKSSSTPRSKPLSQGEELLEIDIETSSVASSDLNMRQDLSPDPVQKRGKSHETWNTARSYSPSSMRRAYRSKKKDRRSRSLEEPPRGQEQMFSRSTRSTSQEEETRLRTLEPDTDISGTSNLQRHGHDRSKMHVSSREIPSSNRSGQVDGSHSQSRKGPSQPYASVAQSSGATTSGIPSHYATRGSGFPNQTNRLHVSDISLSRQAAKGGDVTQKEFFQGTELSSTSLSSIEDDENNGAFAESSNNNQMRCLNEDLFSTGIASLDVKIANLQKKIDRAKAIFS
ncbi:hypothetical protein ElyMa_005856300 [Elysia marginata]|uniref:Uncharacterized protein n=1 Tax=Elysia marginata TaxID=1093978 RepID=A0AAV4G187_9GAST|nr:hypothetical protein ElyMa_005856300 [Elysia marginata]